MRHTSYGQNRRSLLDSIIESVRLAAILPFIKNGDKVLDLGCGYQAKLLHLIEDRASSCIGVDLQTDPGSARSKISLINSRVDTKLPVDRDSVDLITALAIIEHVDYPKSMLSEAHRILKPGGMVIITTPSELGRYPLEWMAALNLISKAEIADHKRYYNKGTLHAEMYNAGFDDNKIKIKHFGIGYLNLIAVAHK